MGGKCDGARGNTGSIAPQSHDSYREHEGREQRGAECEQPEAGNAKRTWFAPR